MSDEIEKLRADYEKALGKKPFNGWSADELKKRIAAAAAAVEQPEPSQEQADEIHEEATGVDHVTTSEEAAHSPADPYPTQADLDAMRAGTFKHYLTR